ncbi:serine-rich adhesin for platelets [Musca domestica]|uniref:Serine-rich adhesin for platelets n=1 Tax=Musca domestica TaxID=7370 RepID=A0ABM3VDX4_MUSDO|nr:serine-rich adhesin for platelets [Musca domestica]
MSFKCQIFRKRLTVFNNVLELSCDVRIIILCYFIIATVLPSDIKCAKLPNPQIRLLINDEDLLHEKTSRHEAAAAAAAAEAEAASAHHADNSGEHFNLYRSELKRLSYETIHRILRDENEPSYRREETELRYYQKRSPPAYEDVGHQLNKRSTTDKETQQQENIALNYSKRNLQKFVITDQLAKELAPASSLDLSDNHLCSLNLTFSNHLQSLKLSNNSFTAIPITGKSQLKTLNLNRNNIISPSSLESNIYLRQLYLSNNGLENILPLNLSLLKNLETLDISCNSLKNLETSFFPERMHNLKHLNMAHNQLGAIYRETFYNLLSLNTLLLGHNNITDIDYETFLALPNLQYLDLSYNALKGKSIRALQGITGLVALNIAYNPELGPYMQEFVASWSLKELDASGTGLCQIPAALAQSVRSLKLTHNWLKVINCGDLDSYPLLQYLDLSHSHIEQIEDDALGRLEILEILMLDHNNLKKIPQSLPVSLEHLFLQYNNIMDIQSQSFQGLTSLKTLDLSNNKLLYLPDITLPKLQTLNLQSSEIRGISQGIIHTLPRLNELLLEDNPIKCSDLLGIAEWASTCRLRTNKEEEVMEDSENDEDSEGGNERGRNLKDNFMKMYNFYEKFGGEQCPRNSSLNKFIPQPKCAIDKKINQSNLQLSLPKKITLERSLEVENFNLNSIMDEAIPLPSKKAGQQAIASNKILAASAGEVDVKAITTNEMPVPITLEMKKNGKEEEENEMPRTTTTAAGTPTTLQSTLASVDKPQEHSNSANASKEFSEMAKALIATNAAGENATGQDREEQTIEDQRNSNGEMNSSTTETMREFSSQQQQKQQQQHNIVGATQTLQATLLPTANLPEILKENMKEKPGKETAQGNLALAADRMTDEILRATTPTNLPKTTSAMAINLTKSQAITGGMADTSKENGEREMTSTTTTTTQPSTPPMSPLSTTTLATRLANVKLNKEQQEIKTEIGLTKKIKSLESSTTQEPAVATTRTTTTTSTTTTPTTIKGLSPPKMTLTSSATTQTDIYANINTQSNEQRRIDVTTSSSVAENTAEAKQQLKEDSITTTAQQLSSKPLLTMAKDKDLASNNTIITAAAAAATHSNNNFSNNNNDMDTDAQDDNNKMSSALEITTTITPRNNVQQSTATSQQHHSWSSTITSPTPTSNIVYQTITTEVENSSMTVTASPSAVPSLDGNDVNDKCLQSNANGCADQRPQRQDKSNVIGKTPTNQTSHEPEEYDVETTTTAAATTMSTTSSKAVVVATTTATPVVHKHEPLQLHVKDRHLIGTPLLMHKGDNLMVATDELIKANPQDSGKRSTGTTRTTTTSTPPSTTTYGMASTAAAAATGPQTMKTILAKSQHSTKPFKKNHDDDDDNVNDMLSLRHHPQHEPFEHKGETIKVKDYSLYAKKSNNADMAKTKKPSLIMKKMTIVTKQHEVVIADSPASATTSTTTISPLPDATNSAEMVNPLNERQFSERHFQELRPQHNNMAKHSTVNTPVNGNRQQAHHLMHEPQTFQHEHELLMQQILHDEQQQQQQQQHEKLSQSEQWSDLRKANNKDNHPGLILLVSSGLFVVLLLGLMHAYRCDVPWRRSSPAHHLRPHQRHNTSLDDDVHSFLSYNEGMQKWHHSTRLEAPYSSPLHNLHVRELQKTSATEKPATIKTSSSYAETMAAATNRHHILPRSNSQSSSTTTRTTSPSSSAMLDDETFYIEMTPPAGQLAQALHSELLPMELLNLAQTKTSDIKETTVGDLQTSLQDDCVVLTTSRGQHIAPSYKASSSMTMGTTTASSSSSSHRDLLISSTPLASSAAAATAAASSSAASASNSQKPLYNSRKFGLW